MKKLILITAAFLSLTANAYSRKEICDAKVHDLATTLEEFKDNPGMDFDGYYKLESVKFRAERGLTQEAHDRIAAKTYRDARELESLIRQEELRQEKEFRDIGVPPVNKTELRGLSNAFRNKQLERIKLDCLEREIRTPNKLSRYTDLQNK